MADAEVARIWTSTDVTVVASQGARHAAGASNRAISGRILMIRTIARQTSLARYVRARTLSIEARHPPGEALSQLEKRESLAARAGAPVTCRVRTAFSADSSTLTGVRANRTSHSEKCAVMQTGHSE